MSLLVPRLLARSSTSPTPLLSSLSLSSSSPIASSSKRAFTGEERKPKSTTPNDAYLNRHSGAGESWGDRPDQPRIDKMRRPNLYSTLVPMGKGQKDWAHINKDILEHFPKPVVGTYLHRPIPEPKGMSHNLNRVLRSRAMGHARLRCRGIGCSARVKRV